MDAHGHRHWPIVDQVHLHIRPKPPRFHHRVQCPRFLHKVFIQAKPFIGWCRLGEAGPSPLVFLLHNKVRFHVVG